jgi:hypothetical protein
LTAFELWTIALLVIMVNSDRVGAGMAVVVTAKSGYDIAYPVRSLGKEKERGYYAEAARLGEAPGRWFGRGVEVLGLAEAR